MSAHGGPNIVNNGLILALDTANEKSFKGEPTTNLISNASTMTGWTNYYRTLSSSTFITEFGTTGYRFVVQPSWNGIYKNFNLVNSGTYTFSAWYRYWGGSASNNGATVYISNYGAGDTATSLNKNIIGKWQRISRTVSVTSPTNVYFYIISYGGTNNGTISPDWSSWDVTMPQIETKSYATRFINGTRGTTTENGGGWADRSGNSNHGELVNGPTYNSDNGGSLVFDGVDDYSDTKQKFNFNQSSQFSVTFWIKFLSHSDRATAAAGIVGKGHYYNNSWDIFLLNNHQIYFETTGNPTRQGQVYLATPILSTNTWYHYVATYNNGSKVIYVNGAQSGTQTYSGPGNFDNTNNVYIARRFGDAYRSLRGNISKLRIYNKALTASEVLKNYKATKERFGL